MTSAAQLLLENARLLLASNGVAPAGVGNQNGLVGRYFMEHASAIIGFGVPVVRATRLP